MTTQTLPAPRPWWAAFVTNSDKVIRFGGLAFVAGAGFAGAFAHMHDWTAEALPATADWLCWSNAVISEIMPTVSFLSWRDRAERKRSTGMPLTVFIGSSFVSLVANLSATGLRIPGDRYFLAALPMLALVVLTKMVLGDLDYARRDRLRAEEKARRKALTAARRAEHARKLAAADAELAAELAAEQARNYEREQAEQAAELARLAREQEAELARLADERAAAERLRLAEIEQAAATERERLAAAERAELRRIEQQREQRRIDAEAAALAEAERIKAEAEAVLIAARARQIAADAAAKEQAAALLATQGTPGKHRESAVGDATVQPMRQRRPRAETEVLAEATLAMLPAGTSRDEAVKAVARAIGASERYAREFVPADWSTSSSAGGEADAA